MTRRTRLAITFVLLSGSSGLSGSFAQTPSGESDAETRALVEREALRAKVEQSLALITVPIDMDSNDLNTVPVFTTVTDQLIAMGHDVAPFLVAEVEAKSKADFHIAAYVLGFLNAPGAKETLRAAAAVAENDGGEFGRERKVWAAYGMAVTGDAEALDLLDSGKLNAIRREIFGRISSIEIASILTEPGSRPKLIERLERYNSDPTLTDRLYLVLHAMRRVAEPSMIPVITPFLEHSDPYVRDAAARALAATGDMAVLDGLIAKLDDSAAFARVGVTNAIEELRPPGKWKLLVERLGSENFPAARASLYRTIATTGGEAAIEPLIRQWGRSEGLDRVLLVDAVANLASKKAINFMRTALKDPDLRVVLRATNGLAAIGGAGAMDTVVALLSDPRTVVELEATKVLVRMGESRAAGRIAENLRRILSVPLGDPTDRDVIRARAEALIRLHDTSTLPDVRRALTTQTDSTLLDDLRRLEKLLTILDTNKADTSKWLAALSSSDADARTLAYVRLADLRATSAARPLIEAFGRVDLIEGAEILRALGRLASPEAVPLVERVLVDPSFDAYDRVPLRAMAAWTARRIGGPKMTELLRRAVERRDGREFEVLVQYAVLGGRDALELLQHARAARLRYHDWRRGPEVDRLDRILRDLKAGRSIQDLDRPPEEISWL